MTPKMQEAREAWYAESGLPTKYEASDFAAGWNAAIEAAQAAVRKQIATFGSAEYAIGQPFSSHAERFACKCVLDELDKLKETP